MHERENDDKQLLVLEDLFFLKKGKETSRLPLCITLSYNVTCMQVQLFRAWRWQHQLFMLIKIYAVFTTCTLKTASNAGSHWRTA